MENLDETEEKIKLLHIIRCLGDDSKSWCDIGKHQGFQVLRHVSNSAGSDPDLKRELLVTFRDILNSRDDDSQDSSAPWRRRITSAMGDVKTAVFNWRGAFKVCIII